MIRRFAKPLSIAVLPLAASFALVSCSSDDAEASEETTAAVEVPDAGQPASGAPSDLIIDDTVTPEGYEYDLVAGGDLPSLGDMLSQLAEEPEFADVEGFDASQGFGDIMNANPFQCTGLAVDGVTVMDWMFRSAETTATAGYTLLDNDVDGIHIMVTTDEVDPQTFPADVSECAEFTREMTDETDNTLQHYTAEPVDVTVEGADVLGAARVTMTGAEVNGEPIEGEGIGESLITVTATVNGVSYMIAASDATGTELVSSLASAQAQRIAAANV